jgi:hypothetical protein
MPISERHVTDTPEASPWRPSTMEIRRCRARVVPSRSEIAIHQLPDYLGGMNATHTGLLIRTF